MLPCTSSLRQSRRFGRAEQRLSIDYPVCADVVAAAGSWKWIAGRYEQAQAFLNMFSSARSSEDEFWEANALLDLSWSADEQAHLDQALDWADAARRISVAKATMTSHKPRSGIWAGPITSSAIPKKLKGCLSRPGSKLKNSATQLIESWLQALGYIYLDAHEFRAAQESLRQSLDLAQHTNRRGHHRFQALAFVSEQTNKLDDAKRYADEALAKAREDNNGRDQVYPRLVQGRVAARLHDIANAESAFRAVAQSPDCPVFLKWEAERSLARLYEDEKPRSISAEHEYRTALNTFETARSELKHEDSRLPFLTNASRIYDDYIHFLVARGKATEALQVADFSRGRTPSGTLGTSLAHCSIAHRSVEKRSCRKKTSFPRLDWMPSILRGQRGHHPLLLAGASKVLSVGDHAADDPSVCLPPRSRNQNPSRAIPKSHHRATLSRLPTRERNGAALFRILVEPAKDLLPTNQGGRKVFIIPDGSLNSLNFETLLVPDPRPHYWIDDVTISSASSLRMLRPFTPHTARAQAICFCSATPLRPTRNFLPCRRPPSRWRASKNTFGPPSNGFRARSGDSPRVSGHQTGALLLYSFRRPRNGQPREPAGLRHRALQGKHRRRLF